MDLVIVDHDDPEAMRAWREASAPTGMPVVYLSGSPLTDLESHQYNLVRSHLSGGLLQLLDRVTKTELSRSKDFVVSDDVEVDQLEPSSSSMRSSSVARALVIDDSLSVRTQMNICLEKFDIDAEMAEDANQGLQKLQDRHYDIVFLDVILPDMDGYQVCKLIKKDPTTRHVPVVMLTSKGSTINRIQGTIAGCDRYLTKPASENDVVGVIRDFLPRVPEYYSFKPV